MSYTLKGRLQSRLATALLPFAAACVLAGVLQAWWPLALVGLMVAVGLALEGGLLHRLLPYQPGWVALPLGVVELLATMGLARALSVDAPVRLALAFFVGSWVVSQVVLHAGLPLLHLSYAEDGGELGRAGLVVAAVAPTALALVVGVAWTTQPPTVHLAAGFHRGPIVLDRAQTLEGEPGSVVRGGIRVLADDVTVRGVTVLGGEYGIDVDGAENVVLEDVTVSGAELDGIHVRRSTVTIRDCSIDDLRSPYAQGIDISFGFDLGPSSVRRCTVRGGLEGIATHFVHVELEDNRISSTQGRGIAMTEMSMGEIEGNEVIGGLGVGIFCGDYSHCRIDDNTVRRTRPDMASGDLTRLGYAIQAHYGATATLGANSVFESPGGVGAVLGARLERE